MVSVQFTPVLSFSGRASRKEFWLVTLCLCVVGFAADFASWASHMPWLGVLVTVALLWPHLAINVKRAHDRGRSGWFLLWYLVPVANLVPLVELLTLSGTVGPNEHGEDPRAGGDYAAYA